MTENIAISEIFLSIDGETTFSGIIACFVRLAGCNLNCRYCDTRYARNINRARYMNIGEIVCEVRKICGEKIKYIVITGGEPLIQNPVIELMNTLLSQKYKIIIETNGSISVNKLPQKIIKILDIKCPSSGESEKMNFDNLDFINKKDEIKFVISNRNDYEFALDFVCSRQILKKTEKILLSPVEIKLPAKKLAEWMMKDKFPAILNLQIHKYIGLK